MELIFRNPQFLWFLALLPVLIIVHFYSLRSVERRAVLFANYMAMRRITGGEPVPKNYILLAARLVTLGIFVLAASGATLLLDTTASSYDVVIALDASSSMSSQDFSPTRFEASVLAAKKFVEALPNNTKVGVVTFSTTAAIIADPAETDRREAVDTLGALKYSAIGGTAIGDAIIASTNAMAGSSRSKMMLLFTDGYSNTGASVADAAQYASLSNVRLYFVGMGDESKTVTTGSGLRAGLDMRTLNSAASTTGGEAINARNSGELSEAVRLFSIESAQVKEPLDLTAGLMAVAFVLVFFDWSLSSTKYRVIP
jgi:Ca-activated chloride channel family protein